MTDFRGKSSVRGIRNNNPGNIRRSSNNWEGKVPFSQSTDRSFEQFISMEYGLRALMKNAITWINRGANTPEKLIHKWAPPHENNTANFVKSVAKALKISEKTVIIPTKENLIALAKVIALNENGAEAQKITEAMYQQAYQLLKFNAPLKKKLAISGVTILLVAGLVGTYFYYRHKKR